jgi:hypothetical protein
MQTQIHNLTEELKSKMSELRNANERLIEQNAELRMLRSEREQFMEMGVRLEI